MLWRVVPQFLEAAEDGRAAVVEEVKTAIAALSGDDKASGDLYERYMGKAITKVAALSMSLRTQPSWVIRGLRVVWRKPLSTNMTQ